MHVDQEHLQQEEVGRDENADVHVDREHLQQEEVGRDENADVHVDREHLQQDEEKNNAESLMRLSCWCKTVQRSKKGRGR